MSRRRIPHVLQADLLRGSGSIAIAMGVMSVAAYGFTLVAARMLGPQPYGALASIMNTLLVIGVLQLGLQATAARRISAEPEHVGQIEESVLRVTYRAALGLGAILLALAPLLNAILKLDSLPTAALIGVAAIPMTIMGGQAGVLQGERRWVGLSAVYIASGVPRFVLGTALMMWRPTEWSAMLGVTLAAFVPVAVGWYALGHARTEGRRSPSHASRSILREALHNSQALFAFFALANADVIVARNVLSEHDAGLYAGGLILAKAVMFLPQFVVVIAFPSMASARDRRTALTRSLGLVALSGVGCSVGAWGLSGLAMSFVGGQEYAEIESRLWIFAVLGTALAMLQLLVYSVLARRGLRSVYAVWGALVVLVVIGFRASNLGDLLLIVVMTDLALFAALFVASLILVTRSDDAGQAQPSASLRG